MRYYYRTYDPVWRLDSVFNDIFGSWSDSGRGFPPVDVYETDKGYVIELEAAGYGEDAISLHVDKHVLTISGKEAEEKSGGELAHEISRPAFKRSFSLPESADEGAISADYRNGVLVVDIPKKAEVQPRRIEVKITR